MSESFELDLRKAEDCDAAERLRWEREVLGFYLSGHPLDDYRGELARFADCTLAALPGRLEAGAERVTVGGLVSGLKVIPIKREGPNHGRRMAVWELEDATASVRVVAFPDVFERAERALIEGDPVLVVATIKGEGDHVELSAEEVAGLDGVTAKRAAALRIVVPLDDVDEERLEELREYLLEHPGDLPVRFELVRRGRFRARLVPPPALTVDGSPETRAGLEALAGGLHCEFEFDVSARNGGSRPSAATENAPPPFDGPDLPPPYDDGDAPPFEDGDAAPAGFVN
jgi:DNA polymerase-3 subunit alpha